MSHTVLSLDTLKCVGLHCFGWHNKSFWEEIRCDIPFCSTIFVLYFTKYRITLLHVTFRELRWAQARISMTASCKSMREKVKGPDVVTETVAAPAKIENGNVARRVKMKRHSSRILKWKLQKEPLEGLNESHSQGVAPLPSLMTVNR